MSVVYTIEGMSILRNGEAVADIGLKGIVPRKGFEKYQHRATRFYKTLNPIPAGDSLVTDAMDEQKEEEPTPTDVRPPLFGRLTTPTKHSLPDDFPEELLRLEGGDKHPDFVRYLKTNHPDLAAKRYHGRIIPTE